MAANIIDDGPITSFHRKLTFFCAGGPFLDGYVLTVIGLAFITMQRDLGLTTTQIGLIGAASLAGIFVGGGVFGYLTDIVGRKVMYVADLLILVIASILCAFTTDAWQLIALRFILGVAVGADYPIASSLLAEFLPSRSRGKYLGALFVVWAAGAFAAALMGWGLSAFGSNAWRYMLASPALFGLVTVLFRAGTPESPRWLVSKGRENEAKAVLRQVYGQDIDVRSIQREPAKSGYGQVFRAPYLTRTIFVSVFFSAHVIPLFAVYTFGPRIMHDMGLPDGLGVYLGEAIISMLFLVGGIPGLALVDRIGRRKLLLWTFLIMAAAFGAIALFRNAPPLFLLTMLGLYAVVSGSCNFIEIIYPNELFPTEIRATAIGVVTAASRIGAGISTFLLPAVLQRYGMTASMTVLAIVNLLGWLVTVTLGIETNGRPLDEAAGERLDSTPELLHRQQSLPTSPAD